MTKNNTILIEIEHQKLTPKKAHPSDAGRDLFSKSEMKISPQEFKTIETGIQLQLPPHWDAEIRPRSGLAQKYGITVLNSPGTIDKILA